MVDDKIDFTRLLCKSMLSSLPVRVIPLWSWEEALWRRGQRVDASACLVTAMSHDEALACKHEYWRLVDAVLIDTHDAGREWRLRLEQRRPVEPIYAGGAVASKLLELDPRPRVICYSIELRSPLVKVLLWQQTDGRADGYYLAESLIDPAILSSALLDPVPTGQLTPPNERDFHMLRLDPEAPICPTLKAAQGHAERWDVISGYKAFTDATSATRKWFERQAKALGSGAPGRRGRTDSVIRLLRRAASGYDTPPM